jgi:hypothetical protein
VLYVFAALGALAGAGWALLYSPAALEREYADGTLRFIEAGARFHHADSARVNPVQAERQYACSGAPSTAVRA